VTRRGARHRSAASSPPRHHCRRGRMIGHRGQCDFRRGRLRNSPTCCWQARLRSVRGEARDCGRRRAIAAAGRRFRGESGEGETRFRPPSTAIYRGRCGPDGGLLVFARGRTGVRSARVTFLLGRPRWRFFSVSCFSCFLI
jgi:hypothetical protein